MASGPRGSKRPPDSLPPPPPTRRRLEPPPAPPPPETLVGTVLSYDQHRGYGFIHSGDVPEGDIYFQRGCLAPEHQGSVSRGQRMGFRVFLTPDGKPRADRVWPVGRDAREGRDTREARDARDREAPPPLDEALVEQMMHFLEEHGGAMDFGKFTRDFRGVKKQQLEPHFDLAPEEEDQGGRWRISLPGSDVPEGRQVGKIALYEPNRGYGFVRSDAIKGDCHFRKQELPEDMQALPRARIVGAEVEFECKSGQRGKLRAHDLRLLAEAEPAEEPEAAEEPAEDAGEPEDGEAAKRDRAPVPPLDDDVIEAMRQLLDENGGAMDYGKFSNAFAGVKKPQLEGHFELVPESDDAGGRWQITLPGVEPPSRENGAAPEKEEKKERKRPTTLEPSESLWLMGFIRKWDQRKNFGFVAAEGADDVFLHRNDLPADLQGWRGSLQGVEVAFELDVGEGGKLRARSVRGLLRPDGRGGWQLRRAPEWALSR